MGSKVTRELADEVAVRDDDDEVDVVVELQRVPVPREGSRAERVVAMKQAFERSTTGLRRTITELGGEVVDATWINQTVHTRVPKRALEGLEADERIVALDAPRTIEPENAD